MIRLVCVGTPRRRDVERERDKQVEALAYVDAFMPKQGESVGQLVAARPGSCVAVPDPTTIFHLVPYPGAPAGVFDAYLKQNVFPDASPTACPARSSRRWPSRSYRSPRSP